MIEKEVIDTTMTRLKGYGQQERKERKEEEEEEEEEDSVLSQTLSRTEFIAGKF
jgi:hypothetical protein